ncbi:MAG: NlpC/P60 family protein [Clostridium sp.]
MEATSSTEIRLVKKVGKYALWSIGTSGPVVLILMLIMVATMAVTTNKNTAIGGVGNLEGKVPAQYIEDFNYASQVSGIPNWVLAAVCKHESSFRMDVVSSAGAYGLMQFRKYENDGASNWDYYLNKGLDKWFKEAGYSYSNSEEAWDVFLKDSKMQILAGSFSLMEKGNYALKACGIVDTIQPFNVENMKLFPWDADEDNPVLRESLRRLFAVYNYGQGAGMTVDLDNAHSNYPNRVYETAMEFRKGGIAVDIDGVIGRAIQVGKGMIGKTTYVYGGGRKQAEIDRGIFDCSSSVHFMYKQAGLKLGPVESATTYTMINMGKRVAFDEMIPGDLVFFNTEGTNSHMGMYIGNNQFIHCGVSNGVVIAEFNSYWKPIFYAATRVVPEGSE